MEDEDKCLDFMELTFMRKNRYLKIKDKITDFDDTASAVIENAKEDDILKLSFAYYGVGRVRITRAEVFDRQKWIDLAF